jgi:hypothetical protein
MSPAERQRRHRAKKRLNGLPNRYWAPSAAVTKPAPSVTKLPLRVDVRALIG